MDNFCPRLSLFLLLLQQKLFFGYDKEMKQIKLRAITLQRSKSDIFNIATTILENRTISQHQKLFSILGAPILFFPDVILQHTTPGENIIATIKMRNKLEMVIFSILRLQYWTFLYCSPFSYHSSNFATAKVFTLNLFAKIFI